MFTFKLVQPDGSPAEQPTFVTAVPDWHEGDTFLSGRSACARSPTAIGCRSASFPLPEHSVQTEDLERRVLVVFGGAAAVVVLLGLAFGLGRRS